MKLFTMPIALLRKRAVCLTFIVLFGLTLVPSSTHAAPDLLGEEEMKDACEQVYLDRPDWVLVKVPQMDMTSLAGVVWLCDGVGPIFAEDGDYACEHIAGTVLDAVWENRPWWQRWLGKKFVGYTCSKA